MGPGVGVSVSRAPAMTALQGRLAGACPPLDAVRFDACAGGDLFPRPAASQITDSEARPGLRGQAGFLLCGWGDGEGGRQLCPARGILGLGAAGRNKADRLSRPLVPLQARGRLPTGLP